MFAISVIQIVSHANINLINAFHVRKEKFYIKISAYYVLKYKDLLKVRQENV